MLSIDSSIFGRDDVLLFYRGNFSRKILPEALAAADVSWVAWKVDGAITLRLWTKSELQDIKNLFKVLGIRPSTRALTRSKRRAPLTITDVTIMDALVGDPKVPFDELLKLTGLSPKTVRNHLNLPLETKTISIDPLLGALADSGELIYPLVVEGTITVMKSEEYGRDRTDALHSRSTNEVYAL